MGGRESKRERGGGENKQGWVGGERAWERSDRLGCVCDACRRALDTIYGLRNEFEGRTPSAAGAAAVRPPPPMVPAGGGGGNLMEAFKGLWGGRR